jgi:uncharacterized delta-60 repeat protein
MSKTSKSGIWQRWVRPTARTFGSASVVAAVLSIAPELGIAQTAGSLDKTFGTGGTVTTGIGTGVSPLGGFEQSNGDIVVVAQFEGLNTAIQNFGLVRYTSTGKLDTAFGTKGSTITQLPGLSNVSPVGFAAQPNGDILVAVSAGGNFALARYTSSGALDTTFGTGGVVTTGFTGNDIPTVLLLQPNGQIVLGGVDASGRKTVPEQTALVRFNSNGSLDTTFGAGGIALAVGAGPAAMALLSNGNYLLVGVSPFPGQLGPVAEFSPTGALLPTVTAGAMTATGANSSFLFQPNGDLVVAATASISRTAFGAKVARFTETGVVDSSFSSATFTMGGSNQTEPQAIALQANGQMVVGGLTNAHGTPVMGGLARLDSNGQLDTTFGSGGTLTTFPVAALLIQTDGKIVAIGNNNGNLALARYLAN